MEIVKINMQIQGMQQSQIRKSTIQVVKDLGIRGLYKGTLATLCRDVPFSLLFFPSFAFLKELAHKKADGTVPFMSVFTSGVIAGAFSAAAVTPMDGNTLDSFLIQFYLVVKTRLQVSRDPSLTPPPYKNIRECYR